MFIQGQRVACIDDDFPKWVLECYTALPVKGGIYTVRDICPGIGHDNQTPEIAITVHELVNPTQGKSNIERAFNAERFAPLEEIEVGTAAEADYQAQPGEEVFV